MLLSLLFANEVRSFSRTCSGFFTHKSVKSIVEYAILLGSISLEGVIWMTLAVNIDKLVQNQCNGCIGYTSGYKKSRSKQSSTRIDMDGDVHLSDGRIIGSGGRSKHRPLDPSFWR